MAVHRNVLSAAADDLYEALERTKVRYLEEFPIRSLRLYRVPAAQPVTPSITLGLPVMAFNDPVIQTTWAIQVIVDGDQPTQADVLFDISCWLWDEVSRQQGFNPGTLRPQTVSIGGSEGPVNVLGTVIEVDHTVGGRTLCLPEFANSTA